MAGEAAQVRFEYRFMEFLNWLDVFLKEHLDHVFLVLVFAALALLIWWRIRRRTPHGSGAAASAMARNAGESPAGRIGRFTTDSPMPVPPRGREGKAVGVLNRQAVMKMNHIR